MMPGIEYAGGVQSCPCIAMLMIGQAVYKCHKFDSCFVHILINISEKGSSLIPFICQFVQIILQIIDAATALGESGR